MGVIFKCVDPHVCRRNDSKFNCCKSNEVCFCEFSLNGWTNGFLMKCPSRRPPSPGRSFTFIHYKWSGRSWQEHEKETGHHDHDWHFVINQSLLTSNGLSGVHNPSSVWTEGLDFPCICHVFKPPAAADAPPKERALILHDDSRVSCITSHQKNNSRSLCGYFKVISQINKPAASYVKVAELTSLWESNQFKETINTECLSFLHNVTVVTSAFCFSSGKSWSENRCESATV